MIVAASLLQTSLARRIVRVKFLRIRECSTLGGSCEHRFGFSAADSDYGRFTGGGNTEVFGIWKHSLGKVREQNSLVLFLSKQKRLQSSWVDKGSLGFEEKVVKTTTALLRGHVNELTYHEQLGELKPVTCLEVLQRNGSTVSRLVC